MKSFIIVEVDNESEMFKVEDAIMMIRGVKRVISPGLGPIEWKLKNINNAIVKSIEELKGLFDA